MELISHHQPEGSGKVKRRCHLSFHLPESCWHPSWLSNECPTRKDPESESLAREYPETNPITIKPETESHVAEQFSWVPLPDCSPPRRPLPINSLALSAHVSPQTTDFQLLDKSPPLGPRRDPRSRSTPTPAPRVHSPVKQVSALKLCLRLYFWGNPG